MRTAIRFPLDGTQISAEVPDAFVNREAISYITSGQTGPVSLQSSDSPLVEFATQGWRPSDAASNGGTTIELLRRADAADAGLIVWTLGAWRTWSEFRTSKTRSMSSAFSTLAAAVKIQPYVDGTPQIRLAPGFTAGNPRDLMLRESVMLRAVDDAHGAGQQIWSVGLRLDGAFGRQMRKDNGLAVVVEQPTQHGITVICDGIRSASAEIERIAMSVASSLN